MPNTSTHKENDLKSPGLESGSGSWSGSGSGSGSPKYILIIPYLVIEKKIKGSKRHPEKFLIKVFKIQNIFHEKNFYT